MACVYWFRKALRLSDNPSLLDACGLLPAAAAAAAAAATAAHGAGSCAQFAADRSGRAGVWLKEVVDGGATVRRWLAPSDGLVADLLRPVNGALVADARIEAVRAANSAIF